jgi:hypothetical protein
MLTRPETEQLKASGQRIIANAIFHGMDPDEAFFRFALHLMYEGHKGQKLKIGGYYYTHPLHVGDSQLDDPLEPNWKKATKAYLHDLLENTLITAKDLKNLGFSEEIIQDVVALTKPPGMKYLDYIVLVGLSGSDVIDIKLDDIEHNNRADRRPLDIPSETKLWRREAYKIAIPYLEAIQNGEIDRGTSIGVFLYETPFLAGSDAEEVAAYRKILLNNSTEPARDWHFQRAVKRWWEQPLLPFSSVPVIT